MNQEQLTVSSVTGVDVELQVAGPGSRSYAFVIDWHFRLLLAIAWFIAALLLLNGAWTLAVAPEHRDHFVYVAVIPTLLIYFFYHPILEVVTHGRTPGKRIAGVRIMTRAGDVPTVGALLIRNLFRLVDSLPVFYVVGLVTTIVTEQHVRIGDMAAGTLLVVDHDREGKTLERFDQLSRQTHLDPKLADLIDELLERWNTLSDDKRKQFGAILLARATNQDDSKQFLALHASELHERLKRVLRGEAQL